MLVRYLLMRPISVMSLMFALGGCSSTMVRVHDSKSDAPIAGAHVVYFHMQRPYFIVGTAVREEVTTDERGNAVLKGADGGGVYVNAPGYGEAGFAGDYGHKLTVFLTRTSAGR